MTTLDVRTSWDRLAAAQKDGSGVPFYMRVVNRRLGRAVAAVAHRVGATPDQVTAVSAGLAVVALGVLVVVPPGVVPAVVVVVLPLPGDAGRGGVALLPEVLGGHRPDEGRDGEDGEVGPAHGRQASPTTWDRSAVRVGPTATGDPSP